MSAASVWAGNDMRRRWRALVALGVLVGVTAGLGMAALAGARRTATALARLQAKTRAADAIVFASQVHAFHPDWRPLLARPEVAELGRWDLVFGDIAGHRGGPLFAAADDHWLADINRPVVINGRMFNPKAPDEMVVAEDEALHDHLTVGSHVPVRPFASGQDTHGNAPPAGPLVDFRVVGIVRGLNQFLFAPGQAFLSPGFVARYGDKTRLLENADVRLRHGSADVAALEHDVDSLVAPGAPVFSLHSVTRRVDTTITVERTSLLLLAAAILVAGGLLVAQVLARSASVISEDVVALRALGMTRSGISGAAVLDHGPVVVTGAVVALLMAVMASRWFPIGEARRIDPNIGIHADWTILVPGLLLTIGSVIGAIALVARRAGARLDRSSEPSSTIAAWIRPLAPVTVGLGTTMAFEGRGGRTRSMVWPALVGAVVGVLGVAGTMTIDHGLRDALAHPQRAGVTWDASVTPNASDYTATGVQPRLVSAVRSASDGAALAVVDRALVDIAALGVPTFTVRPLPGVVASPISLALIRGRAPVRAGEAAVGPATARQLHIGIASVVSIGPEKTPVRVVGEALFPSDVHAEFDQGLWLAPGQFVTVVPPGSPSDPSAAQRILAVRFRPGANKTAALAGLTQQVAPLSGGISSADIPPELTNLRNVRALPTLLAAFLAVLAVASLSHVLVTSARGRRHDFAVLRALGLDRLGTQLVLHWQGLAIGAVGLIVGAPLGIAVGRIVWRLVTERVPLTEVPPFALVATLALIPATIVVVNALAAWPGRHAARVHPAEALHVE